MASRRPLADRLVSRAGSRRRAEMVLDEIRLMTGVAQSSDENCIAALGLMKLGVDPVSIATQVTWQEFESLCAGILRSSGYSVKTNLVLRKPRRQIDIVAASETLALCIDCKHWNHSIAGASLADLVEAQVERAQLYKRNATLTGRELPMLPMLLTLLDPGTRVAAGTPVVPIILLRDFLLNLSRFDSYRFV